MKYLLLLLPLTGLVWWVWRTQRQEPEGIYLQQLRAVWKVKP